MISFPIKKSIISHGIERLILYLLMDLAGRVPFFHYVTFKNFIVTRNLPSGAITRPFCFSAQFKICCFFWYQCLFATFFSYQSGWLSLLFSKAYCQAHQFQFPTLRDMFFLFSLKETSIMHLCIFFISNFWITTTVEERTHIYLFYTLFSPLLLLFSCLSWQCPH